MSNAWQFHFYHNAAYAAFNAAESLYEGLHNGTFDIVFENERLEMPRGAFKYNSMKAASVNCLLARALFNAMVADMEGKYPDFVELGKKEVSACKALEDKLKAAGMWWRETSVDTERWNQFYYGQGRGRGQ